MQTTTLGWPLYEYYIYILLFVLDVNSSIFRKTGLLSNALTGALGALILPWMKTNRSYWFLKSPKVKSKMSVHLFDKC